VRDAVNILISTGENARRIVLALGLPEPSTLGGMQETIREAANGLCNYHYQQYSLVAAPKTPR
jgi:hypothetical protein